MELEMQVNTLKNILTALTATHSEVNLVISSNPVKLQFISSNYECILYWSITEFVVKKMTDKFYRSETVQIDKLLSRLITNTARVSLLMEPDSDVLIFKQYLDISNLSSNRVQPVPGVYNLFSLKIPYLEKHVECNDFITDYVQFELEFNKTSYPFAVFDIRILERMINSSLNYTTEIEMRIEEGRMEFNAIQGDNLTVTSPLIGDTKSTMHKRLGIHQLSTIKAYRKTSLLVSIAYMTATDRQALLIRPITQPPIIDTKLVIFFT